MERKKPKMDEEMKAWFCAGKVRMRLKNETRGRRRSTIRGDYKGLRPFWLPTNWSDDKNIPSWQRLDKCGRFLRTLSRNLPSSRKFAKDEDLWGEEEAALGSLERSWCLDKCFLAGALFIMSPFRLSLKNPQKLLAVFVMRKTELCTLLTTKNLRLCNPS
ncbi:hypothetical protein NC652_004718 [Populus alba x Populus x berolinensis]|nr:hypothetical protein NC652_004718 [Populus alba x Populus x berolinensis]